MKKIMLFIGVITIASFVLASCESSSKKVDVCRCLTEPGDSKWAKENEAACDKAISKKLGVDDWKKVNFSQNPDLQAKWDKMVHDCGH